VVVYVDSGSTDDSVAFAPLDRRRRDPDRHERAFHCGTPRATAGWRRVRELAPQVRLVQFVDGDCSVAPGWLLPRRRPSCSSAPTWRRCAEGDASAIPSARSTTRLCDLEWDTPVGEGALVWRRRDDAPGRAAGRGRLPRRLHRPARSPSWCVRLRAAGWRIWRLPDEMTLHDAAMTRIGQWWKRSMRAGYTYAEGAHLHGAPPERHKVRESRPCLGSGALACRWRCWAAPRVAGPWVLWGPAAVSAADAAPVDGRAVSARPARVVGGVQRRGQVRRGGGAVQVRRTAPVGPGART
jgi:hypothetical protein